MKYRINQIKLRYDEDESGIPKKIIKKLRNRNIKISEWEIRRKSIDARHKNDIKWVYTVDFQVVDKKTGKPVSIKPVKNNFSEVKEKEYQVPVVTGKVSEKAPVIAGFGPCGIFAALVLAKAGLKPIVIERGKDVDSRTEDVENFWNGGKLNRESNVQFGEGGAGAFSDGKLTTGISNPDISYVLKEFVKAGAPEDILYMKKAHIGTDILKNVVKNIREQIIELGGKIYFSTRVTGIEKRDGKISAVQVTEIDSDGNLSERVRRIETERLILAVGHSARDTFRYMQTEGVTMKQKPFSMGVRIQHPQELIDCAQYGADNIKEKRKYLPPAEYKLSHRCKSGRGVYTFCMCPGGHIIMAASEEKTAVTNGMSYHNRDGEFANSGLLVDVRTDDFGSDEPLAGVALQEKYERLAYIKGGKTGRGPHTTWKELRDDSQQAKPLKESLPAFVNESIKEAMPHLGRKLKGFDSDTALLVGVETRSSSPVRFPRSETLESNIKGLYPAGEGTGHAGGIVSAACDGIRVAGAIIESINLV